MAISFWSAVGTGLCAFVLWLYNMSCRKFDYWKQRGVLYKKPVPFFGNIKDYALCKMTQAECLQNIYKEYKEEKYVGMFQLGTPTLLVREPECVKQFLVKDFAHFTDRGHTYDEVREPLTANLVNLEGQRWRLLRHKLTPTFSSRKIKNMIHLLHQCSEKLVAYVSEIQKEEKSANIEIREMTAKFTTDVIGSCAFGLECNAMSKEASEFRIVGYKALQPSKLLALSRLVRVFFPTLFKVLNLRTFPEEVNTFFLKVVKDTLTHRHDHPEAYREDFMQLLADLKNSENLQQPNAEEEEIELTENLIAAQAFVFFLAGFETSSTTLSFCLHELAVNFWAQQKAVEEIFSVAQKYGFPFDYEAVKELEFLEQCLLETMRKYPPVQALSRVCTKAYMIPSTKIVLEKGTAVLIPVYAIHHDEKYYPHPEEFNPCRFSKEEISKRTPGTYMPFGDGPRICIGMRFAILEMKLALAKLLYHFSVTPCIKTRHPLQLDPASFILAPKDGIWLNVSRRKL